MYHKCSTDQVRKWMEPVVLLLCSINVQMLAHALITGSKYGSNSNLHFTCANVNLHVSASFYVSHVGKYILKTKAHETDKYGTQLDMHMYRYVLRYVSFALRAWPEGNLEATNALK